MSSSSADNMRYVNTKTCFTVHEIYAINKSLENGECKLKSSCFLWSEVFVKKITILSFGTGRMWNDELLKYTQGIGEALNAEIQIITRQIPIFENAQELKEKIVDVINQIHGNQPEVEPISMIFTDFMNDKFDISAEFYAIKNSNIDFTELGIRFINFYWESETPDFFDKLCLRIFEDSIRRGDSRSYHMPREFWIENRYRSVLHFRATTGYFYTMYEPRLDYPLKAEEFKIYSPIAFASSKPEPTRNELYRMGLMQNLFRGRKFQ